MFINPPPRFVVFAASVNCEPDWVACSETTMDACSHVDSVSETEAVSSRVGHRGGRET